jgi:hypothetical protein
MPRATRSKQDGMVLDHTLRDLTLFVKDLASDARVEISFQRYEDEDAHIRIYPRPDFTQNEAQQLELALGQRCTKILLETGLFIIGAVYDL